MSSGAAKINQYEKKDVGANRVFIFHLDNGTKIVAKLPFQIAGPPRLTTNSEVATMTYIRKHTNIPVPEILAWSDESANSIGSEYIIMEHAPGVQLSARWTSMDKQQHILCVQSLAKLITQITNLPFPAYGSLYFDNAPINPRFKIAFGDFCIGPHCGLQYWDCNAGEDRFDHQVKPNRGPWPNLREYCSGLIDTGISRIPPAESAPQNEHPYRGTVEDHLRLLKSSESVIGELINTSLIQDISPPTLLHPGLHIRNIFVSEDDPTQITALTDWQSTGIDPIFTLADSTPDMIRLPTPTEDGDENEDEDGDESKDEGENIDTDEDESKYEDEKKQENGAEYLLENLETCRDITPATPDPFPTAEDLEIMAKEEAERMEHLSICREAFETAIKIGAPKFHAARTIDKTLLGPFDCHQSWKDSAAALRQKLIEVSKRWTELGLPDACPYQPTEKEFSDHVERYKDHIAIQRLRPFLMRALDVDHDGWVAFERWEGVRRSHKLYFQFYMFCVVSAEEDEVQSAKLWPFDDARRNNHPTEHESSEKGCAD